MHTVVEFKPQPIVLTYDDYLRIPADGKNWQILEGTAIMTPAPVVYHQRISGNLFFLLSMHIRTKKLGELFDAPTDIVLSRTNIVQPDLVFISTARSHIIQEKAIMGIPDLVVEILSPTTRDIDETVKLQIYARHGVDYCWILDPESTTLKEYELQGNIFMLDRTYKKNSSFTPKIFPELAINLEEIF